MSSLDFIKRIVVQKEISLLDETKETVVDSVFGSIEPLYSDENWNIEMMKEIPLAPPLSDVEEMAVSSVDRVKFLSDLRNESEQVETSLISIPFGNEMKGLEMNFQPLLCLFQQIICLSMLKTLSCLHSLGVTAKVPRVVRMILVVSGT